MVGVAASFDHPSSSLNEPQDVYLHGYVSSRLMNLSRNSDHPQEREGLPVTISSTKVDGLVMTLTPNTHDVNYRSATLYGYASLVTSQDEKLWAMERITNSVVPDRWRFTRVPPDGAEMQSTSILRVKVVGGSGKIRVGGPRDEKKDLERLEIREKTWTGVIPVWECFGDPIASVGGEADRWNLVADVPAHISDFVMERRKDNEGYARSAIDDRSQG
jgi:uncharacterized protein